MSALKAICAPRLYRNSYQGPQSAHWAVAEHDVAAVGTCNVARDGEAQATARLVLVAGMAIGTAFTLFFVPAIYLLIAKDHRAEKLATDSSLPRPPWACPPRGPR